MTAIPQAQSRNPFLSPQNTGASSAHQGPAPDLHAAFQGLHLGQATSDQQPQRYLTPQPTAASVASSSNNPFLDRPVSTGPSRPLSADELAELEGTAVNIVQRETAPPPPPPVNEKARPRSPSPPPPPQQQRPVSSPVPVASSSGRRVAEGNEDFRDDDAALEAAIQASLADAPPQAPSTSAAGAAGPPPLPSRSNHAYAPPPGPPPVPTSARPASVRPASPSPSVIPADPPPAYTAASDQHESTLDTGPRVPDFARQPAPLQPQPTGWSDGGGNPGGYLEPGDPGYRPLQTSGGMGSFAPGAPSPSTYAPPHGLPPPQHPTSPHNYNGTPPPRPSHNQQQQRPGPPPLDSTPSAVPVIGRPYLNQGQTLIYPPGFMCWKCQNTGYKENDPTHPCRQCWKKYGRPFHSGLALSWNPPPPTYQRPLGAPHRPSYPVQQTSWATPPGMYRPVVNAPPVGSVVYQPGDPRIGGALCMKCGGSGLTLGFLLDDETCRRCGGVGRVF